MNLRRAEIVVELPANRMLQRIVDLPMAAAENLREVLSFEMDRNTPFRADEVAFDYRITGTDPIAKRIAIDLTVVPMTLIERATAVAEVFSVTPDRVAIAGSGTAGSAMNLLPSAEQNGRGRFAQRLSISLTIVAFVLAVAAIYLPLHEKRQMLAAYEVRLAESRLAALEADALKERVAAALERSPFPRQPPAINADNRRAAERCERAAARRHLAHPAARERQSVDVVWVLANGGVAHRRTRGVRPCSPKCVSVRPSRSIRVSDTNASICLQF